MNAIQNKVLQLSQFQEGVISVPALTVSFPTGITPFGLVGGTQPWRMH